MEKWEIVAILDRSAGNESVGEMWQETKVFDQKATLYDVLRWASRTSHETQIELFRGNLRLTIAQ